MGSTMTKAVFDVNEEVCSYIVGLTGAEYRRLANEVMEKALMLQHPGIRR